MLRISDKLLIRKIVFGKIGLFIIFIIFIIFARGTWSVYQKADFAKKNRNVSEQELSSLNKRDSILTKELDKLNTKRGLEAEIRHKFEVGKKGERLIILVDSKEPKVIIVPKRLSLWGKMLRFFWFK